MAVALSIKGVPDRVAKALQERAARNHRSLQGELMHILEQAVEERPFDAAGLRRALEKYRIPRTKNESRAMSREDRDSR
jgi:plasmid stability protein